MDSRNRGYESSENGASRGRRGAPRNHQHTGDRRGSRDWEERGSRSGGGRDYRDRDRDRRGERRGGDKPARPRNDRNQRDSFVGPQRHGYREERINRRVNEPAIPADVDPRELDPTVRQELRSLAKDNADMTAKHLIMAASLLDEDPQKALAHARAAKDRAGRVPVARETNGIAAYHAGEWKEAIAELRAARRMSGGPGLVAVLADAERGLGRPAKALEVASEIDGQDLEPETRAELAIVVAGAHLDLQQPDDAVLALEPETGKTDAPEVTRMRVMYAYGDVLEHVGRTEEAVEWFRRAAEMDTEEVLDASDRIAALTAEE
ncbi:tetratricopeptide repeat protein [Corynebacterium heidelbergense]|uniref:tetratricopeptide repeat protein n=1 Tax=Corynebacterium heidelbergense TaxID=2055947 RepID=UPI001EE6F238|nr:tetratricopeptide repeat protein [Corynebacterium heidelbergense]